MTPRLNFDAARMAYDGSKNGLENEYANFVYRGKTPLRGQPKYSPNKTVDLLLPAIEAQILERKQLRDSQQFVPPWKNFKTWINNQCWTQECKTIRVSEQRSDMIDTKNRQKERDMYSDWIMEQEIGSLYRWAKVQGSTIKALVAELRSEIIEYAKTQ